MRLLLGGHADSISGYLEALETAPGADDNASGISTLTEAMRVLVESNYQPKKTISSGGLCARKLVYLDRKKLRLHLSLKVRMLSELCS